MYTAAEWNPAASAHILLADMGDENCNQRQSRKAIKPVDPVENGFVVHQANQEHEQQPAGNPVELLDMGSGELSRERGAVDLHYPQEANQQHKEQQNPIKIAE